MGGKFKSKSAGLSTSSMVSDNDWWPPQPQLQPSRDLAF